MDDHAHFLASTMRHTSKRWWLCNPTLPSPLLVTTQIVAMPKIQYLLTVDALLRQRHISLTGATADTFTLVFSPT